MSRGKRQIISLLRAIIKQNQFGKGNGRLRGGLVERTRVVETCHNYRASLASEEGRSFDRTYDARLNPMIASLRQTAGDRKLSAEARLKAAERLMRISGFKFVPLYDEPIDRRIAELLRTSEPAEVKPATVVPEPAPESVSEMMARIEQQIGGEDDNSGTAE